MNTVKKFISLLLVLVLMLSAFSACGKKSTPSVTEAAPTEAAPTEAPAAAPAETTPAGTEEAPGYYQVGDKIDDFTVTTYDGREVSLYEVLEEKDMVLLNLWAIYCGPCAMEFPAMQEAYEQYQDKVEIIALSTDPRDTDELIADYVQQRGMTFCVGRDTPGLDFRFEHSGIPTSVVVDRFGTICLVEVGAMPNPEIFANVFELYTAEDYAESFFLPSMLAETPNVEPVDPAELGKALNAEGGNLVFSNPDDAFTWPMAIEQKDGRTVAAASNIVSPESRCTVETQVDVKAGDVLVLEYLFQNQDPMNVLKLDVDGKTVKTTALSCDWSTYAYRFDKAGSHTVSVTFANSRYGTEKGDGLWIDSLRLVSGDDAAKALANNPQYPVSEQTDVKILNENVKPVLFTFPNGQAAASFIQDPTVRILVTLDETVDPEAAFYEYGMSIGLIAEYATEDGYLLEIPNDSDMVDTFALGTNDDTYAVINFFRHEADADAFCELYLERMGQTVTWEFSDAEPVTGAPVGDVVYSITYVDQNGNPVPGVMCQVCDDTLCQVFTSDANGVCQFTLPGYAYDIHTLKVPDGYEGDTTTVTKAPVQGGEMTFQLTKK